MKFLEDNKKTKIYLDIMEIYSLVARERNFKTQGS